MSRRGRALAFVLAAAIAAAAAAAIADGYGNRVVRGYGELRPVVIVVGELEAGQPIDPAEATASLEVRRVPARFVPPGAMRTPADALGLVPGSRIPPGSYLLASLLHPPRAAGAGGGALGAGRHPVEIVVSGATPLLVAGARPAGARVDVVVTTEPRGTEVGRTYVAAAAVPLLALGAAEPGPGGTAAATLGLTRRQALRLIAAESFARKLTLLPRS